MIIVKINPDYVENSSEYSSFVDVDTVKVNPGEFFKCIVLDSYSVKLENNRANFLTNVTAVNKISKVIGFDREIFDTGIQVTGKVIGKFREDEKDLAFIPMSVTMGEIKDGHLYTLSLNQSQNVVYTDVGIEFTGNKTADFEALMGTVFGAFKGITEITEKKGRELLSKLPSKEEVKKMSVEGMNKVNDVVNKTAATIKEKTDMFAETYNQISKDGKPLTYEEISAMYGEPVWFEVIGITEKYPTQGTEEWGLVYKENDTLVIKTIRDTFAVCPIFDKIKVYRNKPIAKIENEEIKLCEECDLSEGCERYGCNCQCDECPLEEDIKADYIPTDEEIEAAEEFEKKGLDLDKKED